MKKLTPPMTPERERFYAERLVRMLFQPTSTPFFSTIKIPDTTIDDFLRNEEVLKEARQFAIKLTGMWNKQHSTMAPLCLLPPDKPVDTNPTQPAPNSPPASKTEDDPQTEVDQTTETDPQTEVDQTTEADPTTEINPNTGIDHDKKNTMNDTKQPTDLALKNPPDTIKLGEAPPSAGVLPTDRDTTAKVSAPPGDDPMTQSTFRPGQVPPRGLLPRKPAAIDIRFQVANANVDKKYSGKIEAMCSPPKSIHFRDVRIPANLGLEFTEAEELVGSPKEAGDFDIIFRWSEEGSSSWLSGRCTLIVNPDPKSLWLIKEPPADSIYVKPHTDGKLLTPADADFNIVGVSRRGRSHEHAGTFRDDDFFIHHDSSSGWSIMIVADGAGSAKCSRWGSKLAVEAFGNHVADNLAGDVGTKLNTTLNNWDNDPAGTGKEMGEDFYYLFHKAGKLAIQAIEEEARSQNAANKEYATTLLAAAVKRQGKETFLTTFWVGDGAISAYGPQGTVRLMGTPDSGEFAGQTYFLDNAALSNKKFAKSIRIGRYSELSAVILMTDGVSDPKFETDNELADAANWDALWDEIKPCLDAPNPKESLIDWIGFFSTGNHDDRTIALLW